MGFPSYLEDIQNKAEELSNLIDKIEHQDIAYTDEQRIRVKDIAGHISKLVRNVEDTWRKLGVDDKDLTDEMINLKQINEKLQNEIHGLTAQLKKAEIVIKEKIDKADEEKQKFDYVLTLFRTKPITELIKYLQKITKK
jgi:chromosome segregation ATPase